MPARKKESQINLLPQKGFEVSVSGRVLAWILSTFRVIVIVTEIIVMIAFLSRFWFDAQNSDLNEDIQQKSDIILAGYEFEDQFKDVQKRLNIYTTLKNQDASTSLLTSAISKSIPQDVILVKVSQVKDQLAVSARTTNEKSIQQFIANLAANSGLTDIGLTRINTEIENSSILVFVVSATIGG